MAVALLTTSGSGSWTIPAGVSAGDVVLVETWGAGSGASGRVSTTFGAAGGGGAYAASNYVVTPGDITAGSIAYVIGAESSGTSGSNPSAGGNTSFGVQTNLIRNSSMEGFTAGTPGTFGPGWSITATSPLASTIVGTGISASGKPYVDIRVNGTLAGSGSVTIFCEEWALLAATTTYDFSAYLSLVSGSWTHVTSTNLGLDTMTLAGAYVGTPIYGFVSSPTIIETRVSASAATTGTVGAGTAYFQSILTAGAIDFTLRIAAPQMELGSSASTWVSTPGYTLAIGGSAPSGTTAGAGGKARATTGGGIGSIGSVSFKGGNGAAYNVNGSGGGGAGGADGAGGNGTTAGVGGHGDASTGGVGGAVKATNPGNAGTSNTEGGGGGGGLKTVAGTGGAGGAPGGGGGAASVATGTGGDGAAGQIRLTYTAPTTVSLTGTSTGSAFGSFAPSVNPSVTGVTSSSAIGSFATQQSATVSLTGISAGAAIGGFTTRSDASRTLSGVSATASIGQFTETVDRSVTLTGITSSGTIGSLSTNVSDTSALVGVSSASTTGQFLPYSTASLQGIASTSVIGSFTTRIDDSGILSGVVASTSVGLLAPNVAKLLSGITSNGAVGSFSPSISQTATLVGVSSSLQVGSFTESLTKAFNGVAISAVTGGFVPTSAVSIAHISANPSVGSFVNQQVLSLSGLATNSVISGFSITEYAGLGIASSSANVGSLSIPGQNVLGGLNSSTTIGAIKASIAGVISGLSSAGFVGNFNPIEALTLASINANMGLGSFNTTQALIANLIGVSASALVRDPSPSISSQIVLSGITATPIVQGLFDHLGQSGLGSVITSTAVGQMTTQSANTTSVILPSISTASQVGTFEKTSVINPQGLTALAVIGSLSGGPVGVLSPATCAAIPGVFSEALAVILSGLSSASHLGHLEVFTGSVGVLSGVVSSTRTGDFTIDAADHSISFSALIDVVIGARGHLVDATTLANDFKQVINSITASADQRTIVLDTEARTIVLPVELRILSS